MIRRDVRLSAAQALFRLRRRTDGNGTPNAPTIPAMIRRAWIGSCLLLGGCAEACAADEVTIGVSRLTIRNFGAIVELLNNDPKCGFSGPNARIEVDGVVGETGVVTWSVENCSVDLSEPRVTKDC